MVSDAEVITLGARALFEHDCKRMGVTPKKHVWERVQGEYEKQSAVVIDAADKAGRLF